MAEAASHARASKDKAPGSTQVGPWVGQSISARRGFSALLTGRGRFMDDIGVHPGTLHAAILRSPHAHADIISIDMSAAKRAQGVVRRARRRRHQGADE